MDSVTHVLYNVKGWIASNMCYTMLNDG